MGYKVVLFDADGTLFDFARAESYALEQSFRDFDLAFSESIRTVYEEVNREVWRRFELGEITSERLRTLRFEHLCARAAVDVDPVRLSARYIARLSEASFLLDGAQEVVERLAGRCRLAIVTNGLSEVQRSRFGRSGLRQRFELVVISEEVGIAKPDPAIFAHALEELGHEEKSSVLMVGDSLSSDIQGGANFGIDTCWFNPERIDAPSSLSPTHTIAELAEVVPLCLA